MAPVSNDEQFKLLISCIRYSNNGKVDFGEVAKECKIVSKGAAAKRDERLMKAHGIAPNAASIKLSSSRTTKSETGPSSSPSNPNIKKRKADTFHDESIAADDDEDFGASRVKSEPAVKIKKQGAVKEEERQETPEPSQLSMDDAEELLQYYDAPIEYGDAGMGGEESYGAPGYGGGLGAAYGRATQHAYGLSSRSPYGGSGIGQMQNSEEQQGASDGRGRSDSPVVVE